MGNWGPQCSGTSIYPRPLQLSQSLFERQGLPGPEKLPGSLRKGIPRTKSVGMAGLGAAWGWRTGAGAGVRAGLEDPVSPHPLTEVSGFSQSCLFLAPTQESHFLWTYMVVMGGRCQSFPQARDTLLEDTLEASRHLSPPASGHPRLYFPQAPASPSLGLPYPTWLCPLQPEYLSCF